MSHSHTDQPKELSGLLYNLYYVHDDDNYFKICNQISKQ